MNEPSIIYTAPRHVKQSHNNCVPFSLCALLELLLYMKGVTTRLDAQPIADIYRTLNGISSSEGIDSQKFFKYVMENGIEGFKPTRMPLKLKPTFEAIYGRLKRVPLWVCIRTYFPASKRLDENKTYKIGPDRYGTHMVVIIGWNSQRDSFVVWDSNYLELTYLKKDHVPVMVRDVYHVTI